MINFPTTVIDNFYDSPDKVVEYALSLPYSKHPSGQIAGSITADLFDINPDFANYSITRFLSAFFNLDHEYVDAEPITYFNLIEPYDKDPLSDYNKSWVHLDYNSSLSGLIYLTPDACLNSGTSTYKIKQAITPDEMNNPERIPFHLYDKRDGYLDAINKHNSKFYETVDVKNVYNRMIAYDTSALHCATNYHTGKESRLTQLFFIKNMKTTISPPIRRITAQGDYDWSTCT
jgi:hypothetical protein